jgi:D-glycero-D-manno-heptose 1,7-bisphosphate phosphatase
MVEIHGRPFLEYLIEMLREQGFSEVLLLLGYLPDVVRSHFGNGERFGIRIQYSVTRAEDLTVRRMQMARARIADPFLLMYCDNYWPLQLHRMWPRFVEANVPAMVTVYANGDGYSRDNVRVTADGLVDVFDRSRLGPDLRGVEIGYAILRRELLDLLPPEEASIEEALYPRLVAQRQLAAYQTAHRYYSVGSPERLPATEAFLARTPTVVVDRDGVLNRRMAPGEYVRSSAEFEWLPGALEALALLHQAGYRVIVASNQAGVSRGHMSVEALDAIHDEMRSQARAAGGLIDAIYYCPHDRTADCDCRKPKPGLLFQAQRDFALDLTRTYFIGDDERDVAAADAAGAPSALVTPDTSLLLHTRQLLLGRPSIQDMEFAHE